MTRRALPMLGATGPATEADPEDPLELVGVPVPVDEATFDAMAGTFVEEFVRDGWTDRQLLAHFRSPYYAGLHVIWRRRGEPWVQALIAETRVRWRRSDPAVPEGPAVTEGRD